MNSIENFMLVWKVCTIRLLNPSDSIAIYEAASNPQIYKKRLQWNKDWYTQQDAVEFVQTALKDYESNKKRIFWIDVWWKIVGIISVTRLDRPSEHTALVGARIAVEYQGKWIYKESRKMLTENIKKVFPDITRLESRVFESNKIIPHILMNLWYTKEATLKKRVSYDWVIMDEIIYAKYL